MSRHDLAEVLQDWGELTKAQPLYERALSSLQKALTPHKYLQIRSHPKTNRVRCNLSRLYLRVGRLTQALALARVALADHRAVLGRDHAWTKCSAQATADALDALDHSEEAKALRERYGLAAVQKRNAL
jgi:tetratricopeptide (TPR) repeat protein